MSKQEYMSKLIEALSGFDKEIREEIINDYEDHFVNGLRSGKSEDEIAEELGSIEELVSDLNALSGKTEGPAAEKCTSDESAETETAENPGEGSEEEGKKAGFTEEASAKINDMIKNFATLIGEMAAGINKGTKKAASAVGDGAKDFAGGAKDFANNFASGFMKGYENLAQGVGNMADKVKQSDFAKGVSEGYNRSMNRSAQKQDEQSEDIFEPEDAPVIDDFELDEGEDSECFTFSDDIDSIVIEAESAEIYLDESDDRLNINYENEGNPNQKLAYRFECKQKGKTLYAAVKKQPGLSNFFKTLGCPDISLYVGLSSNVKKVSVKTMSGEVTANNIDIDQLTINSMSGDITIEDSAITITDLHTMSGDIDVTMNAAKSISMNSISGDMNFDGVSESIHAKTTSGDIDFRLENDGSDITANSVSGDIDIELANDSGYVANVKTTSGSIDLNCGDEEKEVTRSGNYILGNGGARLTLSSISGDIDVEA